MPLSKRSDQLVYDDFYQRKIQEKYAAPGLIDIGYDIDWRFPFLLLFLLKLPFCGMVSCLQSVFQLKSYSTKEIEALKHIEDIYFMNEATIEFQLLIYSLRKAVPQIRVSCFQHAIYPRIDFDHLDESQMSYWLSTSDRYFLWDDFTRQQFRQIGSAEIHVTGKPSQERFVTYQGDLSVENKIILFLSGTHAMQRNKAAVDQLQQAGLLERCSFALHPNDSVASYEAPIRIVDVGRDLSEYSVVVSFESTIIVDLLEAKVPLLVVGGDRYDDYGHFTRCESIDQMISTLLGDQAICQSAKSHCVENWEYL